MNIEPQNSTVAGSGSTPDQQSEIEIINRVDPSLLYHEVRAPLRHVDSLVDFMAEDLAAGRLEALDDHLVRVKSAVASARAVIDGMRQYERAGERVSLTKRDLGGLAQSAVEKANVADRCSVVIDVSSVGEHERSVFVEAEALVSCMAELIKNAADHKTRSNGTIMIEVDKNGSDIGIHVRDNGHGIDAAYWDVIFEPLRKITLTTHHGAGLGLPIARRLAEARGGSVSVVSSTPKGSDFLIVWPAAEPKRISRWD